MGTLNNVELECIASWVFSGDVFNSDYGWGVFCGVVVEPVIIAFVLEFANDIANIKLVLVSNTTLI